MKQETEFSLGYKEGLKFSDESAAERDKLKEENERLKEEEIHLQSRILKLKYDCQNLTEERDAFFQISSELKALNSELVKALRAHYNSFTLEGVLHLSQDEYVLVKQKLRSALDKSRD